MVATGFKIYAVTFLAMGYNVVNSMYFTSCGDAGSSAIISTLRGIVFLFRTDCHSVVMKVFYEALYQQ